MKNIQDKPEKNIHEGHRKRLVDLAINAGLDNMSDVQVVELFLTYIFPRGDVNPLAHRLLDKYENLSNIVSASIESLVSVKGINDRSAKMITIYGEMFYYFITSRMGKKLVVSNLADIIDVVEDVIRFRNTENLLLLALSAGNIVTHKRRFNAENSTEVGISLLDLATFVKDSKPASIVIAHCHPYGSAVPSENDKKGFELVQNFCISCGVNLIDSLIVGEDGVFSQMTNQMLRTYYDIEGLKDAFKSMA